MKAAELRDLTVEELTRKAGELRENLFNLKIRRRAGTLESVSDVTKNKRDLARILTLLTQKNGSSKAARKKASSRTEASGLGPRASGSATATATAPAPATAQAAEKKE
jgi:large subunit ribosomal protein L29